jgi:hypothetical protein
MLAQMLFSWTCPHLTASTLRNVYPITSSTLPNAWHLTLSTQPSASLWNLDANTQTPPTVSVEWSRQLHKTSVSSLRQPSQLSPPLLFRYWNYVTSSALINVWLLTPVNSATCLYLDQVNCQLSVLFTRRHCQLCVPRLPTQCLLTACFVSPDCQLFVSWLSTVCLLTASCLSLVGQLCVSWANFVSLDCQLCVSRLLILCLPTANCVSLD